MSANSTPSKFGATGCLRRTVLRIFRSVFFGSRRQIRPEPCNDCLATIACSRSIAFSRGQFLGVSIWQKGMFFSAASSNAKINAFGGVQLHTLKVNAACCRQGKPCSTVNSNRGICQRE